MAPKKLTPEEAQLQQLLEEQKKHAEEQKKAEKAAAERAEALRGARADRVAALRAAIAKSEQAIALAEQETVSLTAELDSIPACEQGTATRVEELTTQKHTLTNELATENDRLAEQQKIISAYWKQVSRVGKLESFFTSLKLWVENDFRADISRTVSDRKLANDRMVAARITELQRERRVAQSEVSALKESNRKSHSDFANGHVKVEHHVDNAFGTKTSFAAKQKAPVSKRVTEKKQSTPQHHDVVYVAGENSELLDATSALHAEMENLQKERASLIASMRKESTKYQQELEDLRQQCAEQERDITAHRQKIYEQEHENVRTLANVEYLVHSLKIINMKPTLRSTSQMLAIKNRPATSRSASIQSGLF